MAEQTAQRLRELPSVDRLLKHSRCAALLARYNHDYVTQKCREVLDQVRVEIRQAPAHPVCERDWLSARLHALADSE